MAATTASMPSAEVPDMRPTNNSLPSFDLGGRCTRDAKPFCRGGKVELHGRLSSGATCGLRECQRAFRLVTLSLATNREGCWHSRKPEACATGSRLPII